MSNLRDMFYLSPIKRYEKYGKFPWKMIITLLLTIFTTCQVLLIVNKSTIYAYSQYALWNALFLNHNIQGSTFPIVNTYNLFSSPEATSFVKSSVSRYYKINNHTIDTYDYFYTQDGEKIKPSLLVNYMNIPTSLNRGYLLKYKLTEDYLGPLSDDADSFLAQAKEFRIEYSFKHDMNPHVEISNTCFIWEIAQVFDYKSHGVITVSLEVHRRTCHSNNSIRYLDSFFEKYNWIGFLVVILAVCSLVSICRYFIKRIYFIAHLGNRNFVSTWVDMGIIQKIQFFDLWSVFGVIGNLCQLFGGFLSIFDGDVVQSTHEALIGLGCFWSWIVILKYQNHKSQSYTIINTLSRSFSIIGPYLIGVLPIFMAYVFFAVCSFWETGVYPNITMGMIASYAVVNGDSVYSFGLAQYTQNSFFGQIYYFTFVVFFICFVQNLFIAIIQLGYGTLKTQPPKDWDDSSDEELKRQEIEKAKDISKKISVKNYRMLINLDKDSVVVSDQVEEKLKAKMENLCEEICLLLNGLYNISSTADDPCVLKHFKKIVEDVEVILPHFY